MTNVITLHYHDSVHKWENGPRVRYVRVEGGMFEEFIYVHTTSEGGPGWTSSFQAYSRKQVESHIYGLLKLGYTRGRKVSAEVENSIRRNMLAL